MRQTPIHANEATATVTAVALHTSRIRVGTLVNTVIYRNPAVVAKAAMTIDPLPSGQRPHRSQRSAGGVRRCIFLRPHFRVSVSAS